MTRLRTALVGFGNAGRIFHAPLVAGVPGLHLHTIVSSRPEAVLPVWPQVRVVATPDMAFADPQVDLVVIATGNESHFPLARAALEHGKHVVVDKPCTVTLAQTEELLALAQAQGKVLTVFQNRRWDADFLALRQVLASGALGRIVYFESHFDRYRPVVPQRWREQDLPGSGLWVDLGAHLADQALQLFGAPQAVLLDLARQRDGAVVNDYFHAQWRYGAEQPGLRVILHGSTLVPALGPRFIVHGTQGSYVKYGMDVQEDALKAGERPQWGATEGWGLDPRPGEITLARGDALQSTPGPQVPGNYLCFYAQLCAHLQGREAQAPVPPGQVFQAMQMLALGEGSARLGQWLAVDGTAPQ